MPRAKHGTSTRKDNVKKRQENKEAKVPNSPLHAWLRACGMSVKTFAGKLGVTVSEMARWDQGSQAKCIPMIPVAVEIERLTGGEVVVESWCGTAFGKFHLEALRRVQEANVLNQEVAPVVVPPNDGMGTP